MVGWRADLESRFRFNPAVGVPDQEYRALEFRYYQQRQPIEVKLSHGVSELTAIADQAREEFQALLRLIGPLVENMAQTAADLTVIPSGF